MTLWKDTLLGDVGSEVARTVRLRKEFWSCQRIQRFLTAERTCTHTCIHAHTHTKREESKA